MRAIIVKEPNAELLYEEIPTPSPGPDELLVKVAACGVCFRDLVDRQGRYPWSQFPATPGHEFSGTVVAIGEGVAGFSLGDRVVNLHRAPCGSCRACLMGEDGRCEGSMLTYGHTTPGAYAEYVIAHPTSLVKVPDNLGLQEASFLNCTAAVALRALRKRANTQAGETVLVTGASGGVGLHGLMIARKLGARVIAATSSEKKAARLVPFADQVIVSSASEFHKEAKAFDVDVVLDCVGTPTLNASMRSLRPGGRLLIVGNVNQDRFAINPGYMILFEIAIFGSAVSSRKDLEDVLQWAAKQEITPQLELSLPLSQAGEAQARLARGEAFGRSVLVP
jgi:acryloyl-coenzyme A reductase